MSRQQWQQVWRIYACAREMDSCRQRSFVESETADPDIVERVLELLESPPDTNEMGTPPPPVDRVGSEFGRYRVTRLLGRGGMGEVYAARDSDLGRTVALKFLLPQGIGDPHHVQGFIREAKAASALNHPNILTVYEVIQSSSGMAIAMEMVEGRALAEFRGSALALAQVAEMGRQVAAALAVAHEQGIVHRDIKPENLMVRPDGLVKVLDFGLARNLAGESAATLNSFASGAPAGTMRYMSPEQLRDGAVTGASDVFALGVVLYELAAGGHPFESAYAWEMANAIGSREPSPPSEMNPELPVWLDELLLSMLKRDPVQRPPAHRVSSILANCSRAASRPNRRRQYAVAAAAALLLTGAIALSRAWRIQYGTKRAETSFATFLKAVPLTGMADTESQPAFSPDGNQVVYASRDGQTKRELFVKLIAGGPPLRLPSAEPNNFNPAWSPDGREIAFIRGYPHDLAIMTMAALGDAERLVGRVDDTGLDERLMTWRPDQKALIASDRTPDGREVALWTLPLDGSRRQKLTSPPSGYSDMAPVFSPDGGTLAFLRRALVKREVYVMGKTGPERRLTFEDKPLESLTWAADGRSLLFNEREVTGPALWKVSAAGGSAQRIANIGNDAINIALAGKVNRLVYVRNPSERRDIWKLGGNAGFHAPTKLIASAGVNQAPAFSPDGAHIAFSSTRSGTMEIWLADSGGNNPVPLTSIGRGVTGSARWSPDGRWIVFDSRPKDYAAIFVISATGGRTREVLRGAVPAWSHDGRWIYYSSDQQIWRVPADGGAPAQVTQHGGFECMASSDGRYLYYTKPPSHAGFWRIPVAGGEENEIAELRSISRNRYWTVTATGIYFLDGDFAPNSESRAALKLLRFSTGRVEVVASPVPPSLSTSRGLAVSPDERTFLWVQPGESIFQIMLVEGFH